MHRGSRRIYDKAFGRNTHKDHEDHIAGKGINSLNHDKLVRKFVPAPQAMKIVEVKSAVEKEWQKPEKTPAWQIKK